MIHTYKKYERFVNTVCTCEFIMKSMFVDFVTYIFKNHFVNHEKYKILVFFTKISRLNLKCFFTYFHYIQFTNNF